MPWSVLLNPISATHNHSDGRRIFKRPAALPGACCFSLLAAPAALPSRTWACHASTPVTGCTVRVVSCNDGPAFFGNAMFSHRRAVLRFAGAPKFTVTGRTEASSACLRAADSIDRRASRPAHSLRQRSPPHWSPCRESRSQTRWLSFQPVARVSGENESRLRRT